MIRAKAKGVSTEEVRLEVCNPVALREIQPVKPAARATDLNNKRIGFYWNSKPRGDVAFDKVEQLLKNRFPRAEFTRFRRECCTPLAQQEIQTIKKLENDVIIATSGD